MVDTQTLGAAATALLRALVGAPLSRDEAIKALNISQRQATNAARNLLRRGYLALGPNALYQLTAEGAAAAEAGVIIRGGPKGQVKLVKDTLRARAWCAMRVRRTFTIGEIVADAVVSGEGQPRDNIARYLSRLQAAGYVREQRRRQPGTAIGSNGFKRFVLVRNTGPLAPVFRSEAHCVFDPNLGKETPCTVA